MGILNLVLIVAGVAAMAAGYARARGPWRRYQALKAQEENISRYESWRGGLRDSGPPNVLIARPFVPVLMERAEERDGLRYAALSQTASSVRIMSRNSSMKRGVP